MAERAASNCAWVYVLKTFELREQTELLRRLDYVILSEAKNLKMVTSGRLSQF